MGGRRTSHLELLCEEHGAKGDNLQARIAGLKDKVTLPPALFAAMHELRLLGNDAAHVEARFYSDIGDDEIRASIALTKEILKSVYQMDALLKQLSNLKTSKTPPVATA